jgi:hypothetical protein
LPSATFQRWRNRQTLFLLLLFATRQAPFLNKNYLLATGTLARGTIQFLKDSSFSSYFISDADSREALLGVVKNTTLFFSQLHG